MVGRGVKSTSNVMKVIWLSSGGLVVMIPQSYTHFTALRAFLKVWAFSSPTPVFNVIPNAGGERVKMWADRHFLGRI